MQSVTSRRRLPHIYSIGQPLFVTFRLHASLPANRYFPVVQVCDGTSFVAMDRLLDEARCGPLFLKQPEVSGGVLAVLQDCAEEGQYDLHAWVIMPNHMDVLLTPRT